MPFIYSLKYIVEEEISSTVSYKSCKRTEADEEFLMVRAVVLSWSGGSVAHDVFPLCKLVLTADMYFRPLL